MDIYQRGATPYGSWRIFTSSSLPHDFIGGTLRRGRTRWYSELSFFFSRFQEFQADKKNCMAAFTVVWHEIDTHRTQLLERQANGRKEIRRISIIFFFDCIS